ncbi:MAG TPA: hypothetical protein PKA28_09365 [Methylomusa anaerophila]|uniref:hypothetical protein n=1 Tax=Methylomusa anaerophila TaxID=1930071 RepID=UPI0013155030|nr:hypothetical protein [Methylomusa anaerophila]HML88646.1 hypothetical protein [Methylomusa anaerophila]
MQTIGALSARQYELKQIRLIASASLGSGAIPTITTITTIAGNIEWISEVRGERIEELC